MVSNSLDAIMKTATIHSAHHLWVAVLCAIRGQTDRRYARYLQNKHICDRVVQDGRSTLRIYRFNYLHYST